MHADSTSKELAALFARYGVEPFLESTAMLVGLLDHEGNLLSGNPALDERQTSRRERSDLKSLLSPSSASLFDELLATNLKTRTRTRGGLEFASELRNDHFMCLLIPMPGQRILFIAEKVTLAASLEAVTAELQRTKRILTVKETELKAVLAQAEEVLHTDALTFLPNRRHIVRNLQEEVYFADRYGTPLSLSMLDIDHFKQINDTYGHSVGDDVLRTLSGELRDHIRHPDLIGRYGGEEFIILLPHSTSKAASEQAERLCKHVRSLRITSGEHEIALTVSVGIAQYRVHMESWEELLNRADSALYQAKKNGRDRWVVSEV